MTQTLPVSDVKQEQQDQQADEGTLNPRVQPGKKNAKEQKKARARMLFVPW